jgi:CBS domain-containing protein/uncharacterized protein (DUF2267 family)
MSLEKFVGDRLVIQSPETRIYDAVRAMLDNRVGCVLVHDGKALVGIVTDRDLGLEALADDLDALEFQLSEVMSSPVASVTLDATLADVTELMVRARVRRVPIVDGASIAGIVSLDDLILEQATDVSTLAAILRAQLSQPSRLKPAGQLHPSRLESTEAVDLRAERRHEAHQRQAYARILRRTLSLTGLTYAERAEDVLQIVLFALLRRVTREQAAHLLAQLPSRLRRAAAAELPSEPDLGVTRAFIERALARRLAIEHGQSKHLLDQVGRALRASISAGEIDDFVSQLPADMKTILAP